MSTIDLDAEPAGLRERKKAQTRRALHDAALRLVEREGLDGTTVERICEEAGVSARTFFNYYPSKASAVLGVPDALIDDATAARFRSAGGDVIEALCAMIGDSFTVALPERRRIKDLVHRFPELHQPFQQWMQGIRERIIELAGERTDSSRDAVLAVTLVFAAISGVLQDPTDSDAPMNERLLEIVRRMGELARG